MVKIELNLLNIFALRVKKQKLYYEGKTVRDVITQFIEEHKNQLDNSILTKDKRKLSPQMVILLNGRNISYLKKYKTKLKEGDKLYISFPISGG
ncbi:MAG: MoaD/ThiS family protein [Candidatus Lokiarchaeota archaeon]|jgi:molybdopterin converting factor small subunit